ncbi:MAG TPA: hypothetical protein VHD32_11405 [Candidatus Didemnitutus sp.]|nr:hypothetical protein [Candidatus Didemnitutus sp.]
MNSLIELNHDEQSSLSGGADPASLLLITLTGYLITYWSQMKTGFADGVTDGYNKVQSL